MRLGTGTPLSYNGTEALYMRHEREVLRSILGMCDAGHIERTDALRQIGLLHAAKSMLGATICAEDDPWIKPPMTPIGQSSEGAKAA